MAKRGWPGGRQKFDDSQLPEFRELARKGLTLEAIGQQFGLTRQRVLQLCHKHNVQRPPRPTAQSVTDELKAAAAKRQPRQQQSDSRVRRLGDMWRQGWPVAKIAERDGTTASAVNAFINWSRKKHLGTFPYRKRRKQ